MPVGECGEGEGSQHGHACRHRCESVPCAHGGIDGEQERDSRHVEANRLVAQRACPGHGEDDKRDPSAGRQRESACCEQCVAKRLEGAGGGLRGHT